MKYNRTISAVGMRAINRTAIVDLIRRESPLSRSYISETLGISLPTVMRFVDELIANHLTFNELTLLGVALLDPPLSVPRYLFYIIKNHKKQWR